MHQPEGPHLGYPSLWVDPPTHGGVKSPKRRCHKTAREASWKLSSRARFGEPDSLPSGCCTINYAGGPIWLDTARQYPAKRPAATPSEIVRRKQAGGASMTEFRRQSSKLIALPGDQSDWDAEELARPLRTSSQGRSRSNQPPRLIDQNAVGLVERVEADESALRSLSSEFTHINSRWSRLEKPFSNSLEDPTSNMTAVSREWEVL